MPGELKTLTTFTYAHEPHLLLSKLEGEGIECFLENENLVSAQPLLSNAIGGIILKVKEEDFGEALSVFQNFEQDKKALTEQQAMRLGTDYKKVFEFCPKCDSGEVYRLKGFSLGAREHICADCGYTWKQ